MCRKYPLEVELDIKKNKKLCRRNYLWIMNWGKNSLFSYANMLIRARQIVLYLQLCLVLTICIEHIDKTNSNNSSTQVDTKPLLVIKQNGKSKFPHTLKFMHQPFFILTRVLKVLNLNIYRKLSCESLSYWTAPITLKSWSFRQALIQIQNNVKWTLDSAIFTSLQQQHSNSFSTTTKKKKKRKTNSLVSYENKPN